MSAIEPTTIVEQYDLNVRVTQDWSSVLDKMARDIADRIDEATLARLGYVKQETCRRVMDSIDPFSMWVCDHCGHPLDTSENFCGGCGRKVVVE